MIKKQPKKDEEEQKIKEIIKKGTKTKLKKKNKFKG